MLTFTTVWLSKLSLVYNPMMIKVDMKDYLIVSLENGATFLIRKVSTYFSFPSILASTFLLPYR